MGGHPLTSTLGKTGLGQMDNNAIWPLKWFNLFAIPIAITMAIHGDSFWTNFLITATIGFVIAGLMGMLFVIKSRSLISKMNPLSKLSAQMNGDLDNWLHIKFITTQGLSGILIIAMWFFISSIIIYFLG